jgi:hypothetical protein
MAEPNYQAIKVGAGPGSTIRAEKVICGHSARIPARGRGSNRQSRRDIVLVGDHAIEILSIE